MSAKVQPEITEAVATGAMPFSEGMERTGASYTALRLRVTRYLRTHPEYEGAMILDVKRPPEPKPIRKRDLDSAGEIQLKLYIDALERRVEWLEDTVVEMGEAVNRLQGVR